jgi:hypothetical protein
MLLAVLNRLSVLEARIEQLEREAAQPPDHRF